MIFATDLFSKGPEGSELPEKSVLLEDKGKVVSYPGEMHSDDIKFHSDVNEYGKTPHMSLREILTRAEPIISDEEWLKMGEQAQEVVTAVPKMVWAAARTIGEDLKLANDFINGRPLDFEQRKAVGKTIVEPGTKIANALFETFVGRIYEPVRQFVGDIATGQTEDIVPNVIKAAVIPSSVKKISSPERMPFTQAEREGGVVEMIPRALAGAVEDVLLYGGISQIPKMLANYQVNSVRRVLLKNTVAIHAKTMEVMDMNAKQAWEYMNRPDVSAYLYRTAEKSMQKPTLLSGVPVPKQPGEAVKSVAEGVVAGAKKPETIAKAGAGEALNGGVLSSDPLAYDIVNREKEPWQMTRKEFDASLPEKRYSENIPINERPPVALKIKDKIITDKDAKMHADLIEKISDADFDEATNRGRIETGFIINGKFYHQSLEAHKTIVKNAITDGKQVPKDVVSQYPDLMDEWRSAHEAARKEQAPVEPPPPDKPTAVSPGPEEPQPPKPPYKERRFVTSIKEELPILKVAGQYIPRSTDELAIKARTLIQENIEAAEKLANTGVDDKAIATAAELLKHYTNLAANENNPAIANALYEKAAELGNKVAVKLTELGRSVQAASILARLTPEGQLRFAAKTIQKYNEEVEKDSGLFGLKKKIPELSPEQGQEIITRMKGIETMPDGDAKAIAWKELQDYISDLVPTPLLKKITTVWKAGLLTGLKTSGVNILSNFSHAFGTEVLKDIPGAAVDSVVSLFTKKRALGFTMRGIVGGAKEGFVKGYTFLKTGYDERRVLEKYDYHRVNFGKSKFAKALQAYEETVFKLLGAEDQVFFYGARARSIVDQAIITAKNEGLSGKKADARVNELIENPTDDMLAFAIADAETAVFQNETFLSKAGSAIQRVPGAEFVLPFSKTPSAVAMQIINYSPVGFFKTAIRNIGEGKFNQRDFSQGMGRAILGIPILWLGYELFRNGLMNLDRPKSEGERKQWELEGRKPNAIKFGDKWRSIQVFGPAGNLLIVGGQFAMALEKSGSPTEAMSMTMAGSAKSFSEQTFLKGMSMAADALTDPAKSGEYFTSGLVSSFIPTIVADVARATDKTERRVEDIPGALAARIPVIRENLQPQVDLFGRDRMMKENFFEIMFDPTRPTTEIKDPIVGEIRRLIDAGHKVSTTQVGTKKGYSILTPEQNTDMWRSEGAIAYDKVSAFMQLDGYETIPDDIKAKNIDTIFDKAGVSARVEKVIEITNGLSDMALKEKLSEAKKSGLMNREVFKQYQKMR